MPSPKITITIFKYQPAEVFASTTWQQFIRPIIKNVKESRNASCHFDESLTSFGKRLVIHRSFAELEHLLVMEMHHIKCKFL